MVSASAEFFSTPVLLTTAASHLDKKSLARLSKTCRNLHSVCVPLLWNTVDLLNIPNPKKIKSYVKQLKNLTTNVDHVHSLKIGKQFLVLYSNGVNSIPKKSSKRPRWLPYPNPARSLPNTAFQPLTRLTRLECLLGVKRMDYNIAAAVGITLPPLSGPPVPDDSAAIENLCYLLGFNPGLTHLKIVAQEIETSLHIRLLARAISKLKKLEQLELGAVVGTDPWRDALPTVFLSCPESLESLVIRAGSASRDGLLQVNPTKKELDHQDGPVVLRQGSLPRLSKLTLVVYSTLDLSNYGILQYTPNLTTLEFQFLQDLDETNLAAMAPAARANCRYLRNFVIRQPQKHDPDTEMIQLLAGLNPILETLNYDHFQDDSSLIAPVLQRHSCTLRDIRFRDCHSLRGETVRSILTNCAGLQRFQVLNTDGTPGGSSKIEDLVAKEWVCTKIRHLELEVNWGDFEEQEPYYMQKPPKRDISPKDQDRWSLLEKLYRQLGTLEELEVLGLQAGIKVSTEHTGEKEMSADEEEDLREQAAFPQLFTLGNPKTHRRGYMTWLTGLTKLKELRGSIHMASPEIAATLGRKEVLWMTEHFPSLGVIELLEYTIKIPERVPDHPHLNLFMKHLPGIDICRPLPPSPLKHFPKSPYETDIFTVA